MKELDYFFPKTLEEALQIKNDLKGSIKVIAGGTDLVVHLKQDQVNEDKLLDVSRLEELKGVVDKGDTIYIGAGTTHTEILENTLIKDSVPILFDAIKSIGSPQIRNIGTIGGNIANASPAGDSIPALFVLLSKLHVKSVEGSREIPIEDFFLGPGKTALKENEIIMGVEFEKMKDNDIGFFRKVGQRKGTAISVVNAAVRLTKDSIPNKFSKAYVALGAVAPTVVRAKIVENALTSEILDSLDKIMYIARLVYREVSPITDVRGSLEYRRDVSINIVYEGIADLFLKGFRR
ncbi:FAD binding domain-containing protein [Caldisericum exile]|uniref:Oxidoreductase FAD binding subunit n=1 Tax=Caldisericum exile (strain DSM 21853 / NBRC 104410 / AZM16c01) TaxID=511051 RepID=A0A7U6GDE1_CALEA|nr:xanthine dehydrogenase family protein subunit M [Caldisericum exile]BAL80353.1 oxidoreductase FAD binding subunit [Caldisericum exile AZM16c01]